MSGIQKEIIKLLKLAKSAKDESEFQLCTVYKAFKARKIGHRSEIDFLIQGLTELEFSAECIYWLHRFFKDRVCNKEEKVGIFRKLSCWYFKIDNHEKTIEFGQKFLEIKSEEPLIHVSIILEMIVDSSEVLDENEDCMKYRKEILKINILRFNKGEINQREVLEKYHSVITRLHYTNSFSCIEKTMKKLKLFNLNSKDPNDVKASFDKEYQTKNFEIELFLLVGRLCFYKSRVLQYFCDRINCSKWATLHFEILYDIQQKTRQLERNGLITEANSKHESILLETIFSSLNLSYVISDFENRKKLFLKVYLAILQNERFISYYIGETVKEYSIKFGYVMPFINFCIKNLDEAVPQNPPSWSIEEGRKKLIAYKNSLIIWKHLNPIVQKKGA